MHVNSVNNINHKGQIKKTSLLTEAVKYARTEELKELNNLLDKAKLVNDYKTFILDGKIKNIINQKYKIISAELFCLDQQNIQKIAEIKEKNENPYNRIIKCLNKNLEKVYNK